MLRKSNPVHSAGTGWSIFGDEKIPYISLFGSARRKQRCAGHLMQQRCSIALPSGRMGRKSQHLPQFYWKPVEQNSRTLQQPRHFQLDVQHSPTLILYRHSPQLHMSYSCAGIPRTHQGFARSWGAGQGMPYLRSREIVTLALNSKQTNKENFEVLQQPHSSYWIGIKAFHRAEQYSLYTDKSFATKTFMVEMKLFRPRLCLFDRKTTALGVFRDYNTRFPSDLLPLRQAEHLIPEERTQWFCAPKSFSRTTLSCPIPQLPKPLLWPWQTNPPFTPSWGDWTKEGC